MNNFIIKPVIPTSSLLRTYLTLLQESMDHIDEFSLEYLNWLYCQNPDGKVLGYDAWHKGELVAHYVCIPRQLCFKGKSVMSLISLNTATHPRYRKLGLFKKLALKTYEDAKLRGFKFVIGVGNNASTPGFLKHLGFDLIAPLSIKVGFGGLKTEVEKIMRPEVLKFGWDKKQFLWRLSRPSKKVALRFCGDNKVGVLSDFNSYLSAYTEIPFNGVGDELDKFYDVRSNKIRLFVGLAPDHSTPAPLFFDLPNFLRPAPLFLIFKPLDRSFNTPTRENVFFSFLDFDVF